MLEKVENNLPDKFTPEQFLKLYHPLYSLKTFKDVKTIETALACKSATLVSLERQFGEDFVIGYIELWLIDLKNFVNVKREMSKEQINYTAELIYSDFRTATLTDVYFIFTEAKKGKLGNLYESLDGAKVYQWFDKYFTQRGKIAYEKGLNKHDVIKKHGYDKSSNILSVKELEQKMKITEDTLKTDIDINKDLQKTKDEVEALRLVKQYLTFEIEELLKTKKNI